jgi:hemerythrin HHE cation binding domain-containing protein
MPCDAGDMFVIHRVFRREFADLPALIAAVPAGDAERAAIVGDHVKFIVAALHHHHAAEDDLAWPRLQSRAPASAADVARMLDGHAEIAVGIERVESLLRGWTESAEPFKTEQLSAAASDLADALDRHLDDEERNAVPLIEEHLTQQEWAAAIKRAASFISVRNLRLGVVLGGLVLDEASPQERQKILSGAPIPQRIVVQLFGARTAASYRRRLHGSPV